MNKPELKPKLNYSSIQWHEALNNMPIEIGFRLNVLEWEALARAVYSQMHVNCRETYHYLLTPFYESILREVEKFKLAVQTAKEAIEAKEAEGEEMSDDKDKRIAELEYDNNCMYGHLKAKDKHIAELEAQVLEAERRGFEAGRAEQMYFVNHETKEYTLEATGNQVQTEIILKYADFDDWKKQEATGE
ncbi:MAG: hypothetical protein BWY21_00329 [Parcubacteria group bacterium ADurb.Bin216]|nr:MAG: hypothetical protein BWY21_00329 [Parcubacteria group bacterium ADurb.Bin216]